MASNPRAKRALPVDDVGDWDEDCDNEEDGEEDGDAYDWSKPVLMEDSRDYSSVRGKQSQSFARRWWCNQIGARNREEKAQNYEKGTGYAITPSPSEVTQQR